MAVRCELAPALPRHGVDRVRHAGVAVQCGATLIPPEAFLAKPAIWLRALSQYKGLISPAPNFAYALATERIADDELDGVDLSCWRYALNGAEPVNASTMRAFTERFAAWGLRPEALNPVYG